MPISKLPKELEGPFVVGRYNKSKARLYLKRQSGEVQIVDDVKPALFVAKPQMKDFPLDAFPEVFQEVMSEGKYYRINMKPGTKRDKIDEILHLSNEEQTYPLEADVNPIRRWFSDTGSLVSSKTKALFFDLETDTSEIKGSPFDDEAKKLNRILTCSLTDYNTGKKWFLVNYTVDDAGEAKLIEDFLSIATNFDTLLAWNGRNFDFFVLKARAKYLKIKVNWKLWNLLDYMEVVKKCLMSISDPKFKRSFALDALGQNVLGIKKIKILDRHGRHVPMNQLKRFVEDDYIEGLKSYNDRDVEIMVKLEEAREFLALHMAVCSICRQFPDENSVYPNILMDGMMLRLAVEQGRHFRSRYKEIEEENLSKFAGAYVKNAEIGFHEEIMVIDFSSLYPSIMISWNMSPDTKLWDGRNYNVDRNDIATASATGVRFRTDFEGMLPMAERTLLTKRKEYAKKQKNAVVGSEEWKRYGHESTAVKVVANSMYGLLGSPYSRYYDRDIAQSVTLTGQLLIKACIDFAEDMGIHVIAGDTDSCFVKANEEQTKSLIKDINEILLPRILNEQGCKVHRIVMDFDKGYKYLLIQAKKKYAGKLLIHKGRYAPDDMEPDVKGLEFQRSDQIRIAQRMQMHFLHDLLNPTASPRSIERELRTWADNFMFGDVPLSDIEITQGVKKHPNLYNPPTPASRVAEQMIEKGAEFFPGMKVPYFVVASKERVIGKPASEYDGNFDCMYYWTNKILPPVQRLIEARFPNFEFYDLKTLMKNPKQTTLDFVEAPMKVKKVKMPKAPETKKVKKVKTIKTIITFSEVSLYNLTPHIDAIVSGVSKLVKGSEVGPYKIYIQCSIESLDAKVEISTKHKVTKQCLRDIKEMFPSVQISPKVI